MGAAPYQEAVGRYRALVQQGAQHFAALRDAGTARQSVWEPNFQRAFLVFSALWRYQHEHRAALTEAGLQRWEVGDIACKLGQLYYSCYLHTAQTRYLLDAVELFGAVQARGYFAGLEPDAFLAGKKLRFYGRYVVAALMAGRPGAAVSLVDEMAAALESGRLAPEVRDAWQATLGEVRRFVQVLRGPQGTLTGLCRLTAPCRGRLAPPDAEQLPLGGELLVGSQAPGCTRIAELSLDTYRVMQALEFDIGGGGAGEGSHRAGWGPGDGANPAKNLLIEPEALEVVAALATLQAELPPAVVALVYLPGSFLERSDLSPQDLAPFTRRPLFLVVDGEDRGFQSLCELEGGEPAVLLESRSSRGAGDGGSLFTLFLSSPALGFCALAEGGAGGGGGGSRWKADAAMLQSLESRVAQILDDWWAALLELPPQAVDPAWARVLDDPFLGQFALRFAFARAALALFRGGESAGPLPACCPELPTPLAPDGPPARRAVAGLARAAGCARRFAPAPE